MLPNSCIIACKSLYTLNFDAVLQAVKTGREVEQQTEI
jgi:hypothetical protein